MNEIIFDKYTEFKTVMDAEIKGAVQGFVNIGYLLKVARDTNILHESGYQSVAEFAKAEYGLTKDMVSRYIRINTRFSENGYSMSLRKEFENFGIGKLQEMLALPDGINDVLTPQLTKEQIIETRREYQEEQQVTDVEVMLEAKDEVQQSFETTLAKAIFQYLKEHTEAFVLVNKAITDTESMEERFEMLFKALAPKGVENLFARIPGTGKIMIAIAGRDKEITVINMRSSEKETYGWPELLNAVRNIWTKGNAFAYGDVAGKYESIFGEKYTLEAVEAPKEEMKVAPVQPNSKPVEAKKEVKTELKKENQKETAYKAPVQQEEKEDAKEDEASGETIPVENTNEVIEVCEEREEYGEVQADSKPAEQHCEVPLQRQNQQEALERRKREIKTSIKSIIKVLEEAVDNEWWNTAKLRLTDIKVDIEHIEKIEHEIEDLNDTLQMRLEDYE